MYSYAVMDNSEEIRVVDEKIDSSLQVIEGEPAPAVKEILNEIRMVPLPIERQWLNHVSVLRPAFKLVHKNALGGSVSVSADARIHQALLSLAGLMVFSGTNTLGDSLSSDLPSTIVEKLGYRLQAPDQTLENMDLYLFKSLKADALTEKEERVRAKLVKMFAKSIEYRSKRECTVVPVGSACCGLAGKDSDLDLGIAHIGQPLVSLKESLNVESDVLRGVTPNSQQKAVVLIDMENGTQKKAAIKLLHASRMLASDSLKLILSLVRKNVRIPLLKYRYEEDGVVVEIDIGVLAFNSHHNPRLVNAFAAHCPSFLPLARIVKLWAKRRGIVDASRGYFNSWTLSLMVAQYLQLQGLLPVVHTASAECPTNNNNARKIPDVFQDKANLYCDSPDHEAYELLPLEQRTQLLVSPLKTTTPPAASLATLFAGFIAFYAFIFDPAKDVICVRRGRLVPREQVDHLHKHETRHVSMIVEEPFQPSDNTARALRAETLPAIMAEFKRAALLIAAGAPVEDLMEAYSKSCKKLEVLTALGPEFVAGLLANVAPESTESNPMRSELAHDVYATVLHGLFDTNLKDNIKKLGKKAVNRDADKVRKEQDRAGAEDKDNEDRKEEKHDCNVENGEDSADDVKSDDELGTDAEEEDEDATEESLAAFLDEALDTVADSDKALDESSAFSNTDGLSAETTSGTLAEEPESAVSIKTPAQEALSVLVDAVGQRVDQEWKKYENGEGVSSGVWSVMSAGVHKTLVSQFCGAPTQSMLEVKAVRQNWMSISQ